MESYWLMVAASVWLVMRGNLETLGLRESWRCFDIKLRLPSFLIKHFLVSYPSPNLGSTKDSFTFWHRWQRLILCNHIPVRAFTLLASMAKLWKPSFQMLATLPLTFRISLLGFRKGTRHHQRQMSSFDLWDKSDILVGWFWISVTYLDLNYIPERLVKSRGQFILNKWEKYFRLPCQCSPNKLRWML